MVSQADWKPSKAQFFYFSDMQSSGLKEKMTVHFYIDVALCLVHFFTPSPMKNIFSTERTGDWQGIGIPIKWCKIIIGLKLIDIYLKHAKKVLK